MVNINGLISKEFNPKSSAEHTLRARVYQAHFFNTSDMVAKSKDENSLYYFSSQVLNILYNSSCLAHKFFSVSYNFWKNVRHLIISAMHKLPYKPVLTKELCIQRLTER
jgi:hypothetical protein